MHNHAPTSIALENERRTGKPQKAGAEIQTGTK